LRARCRRRRSRGSRPGRGLVAAPPHHEPFPGTRTGPLRPFRGGARGAMSATDRAYTAIRAAILDGRHRADTMLSETDLAESIGVSRTPVRTALTRLQDEGWITIYPKRGALVRGLDERTITDLADARLVLEATSVRRASPGQRAVLAERLAADLDAQERALAEGDIAAFVEMTVAFHRGFVEAGGNSVMLELYDRLADRQRFLLFDYGEVLL